MPHLSLSYSCEVLHQPVEGKRWWVSVVDDLLEHRAFTVTIPPANDLVRTFFYKVRIKMEVVVGGIFHAEAHAGSDGGVEGGNERSVGGFQRDCHRTLPVVKFGILWRSFVFRQRPSVSDSPLTQVAVLPHFLQVAGDVGPGVHSLIQ